MLRDGVPHDNRDRFEGAAPPTAESAKVSIPIIRPEAKNGFKLQVVFLSDRVFGVQTHYHGRTKPCGHPNYDCRYCNEGREKRWRGYAAVLDMKTRSIALLELTGSAATKLDEATQKFNTLRGVYANIDREKPRPNAKVLVRDVTVAGDEFRHTMPDAFDVKEQLTRIWKLHPDGRDARPNAETEATDAEERPDDDNTSGSADTDVRLPSVANEDEGAPAEHWASATSPAVDREAELAEASTENYEFDGDTIRSNILRQGPQPHLGTAVHSGEAEERHGVKSA